MSKQHCYQFHINKKAPDHLIDQLERKIDELFCGHYEKTGYGFYARDSPAAGAGFLENDPGYINKKKIISELREPWVDDRWRLQQNEEIDYEVPLRKNAEPYVTAIKRCVYEWADDTACSSGEEDITGQI